MKTDEKNPIGLSTSLAPSPWLIEGLKTIEDVVALNKIGVIEGPPGTGKTTTVRLFREKCERPVALTTMPGKPAPLDLLRLIHEALTGAKVRTKATRYELQCDLLDLLREWRGVLIVDELQNSLTASFQDLVWLHEETDQSFAVVAVGTTVLEAVQSYPQLHSRIMGSVTYQPLIGQDLVRTVQSLDPRLAATGVGLLLEHDANVCRGILRRWIMTIQWLNTLGIPDRAVDAGEFANIARKMPTWN